MNYLEQTYLKQIAQLQEELNVLKSQEKTLTEQTSFDSEADVTNYAEKALNNMSPETLVRDAATALIGSAAVKQSLGDINLKDILQKNMKDFLDVTLVQSLRDVGSSLANTLVNAAGRNPFQLAKAVSVTRYNPFAIFDPTERSDGTKRVSPQTADSLLPSAQDAE